MAYSTSTEVTSDFKNITFSTTTMVTTADVDQFIVEADALINSYIGMRYSTPVAADASTLALLKLFSRTLVADRIKKIMEVKQTTNTTANQDVRGAYSTRDVMSQLKQIQNGDLKLSGATLNATGGGIFSNNVANAVEPVFKKGCKQW